MSLNWRGDEVVKKIEAIMGRRLKACAQLLERAIKKNIGTPQRQDGYSKPGAMPHSGSGRLRKSIFHAVDTDALIAVVGVPKNEGVVYGRYLEEGHDYTPDTKKYMAVPISDEAKRYRRQRGSVRNFPKPLTLIPRKGKPPLLVEKKSKRRWIIHYILLKKARVSRRPYLLPTLEQNLDQIRNILGAPLS